MDSPTHDTPRGPTRRCLALTACWAAAACAAAAPPSPAAPKPITARPGTEVSFSFGPGPAAGKVFEIAKLLRDGEPAAVPKNLQFDTKTGRVTWTPRNSQAGRYELKVLVYDQAHPRGQEARRRIHVDPGPITTDRDKVGTALRQWYGEGTAAGNVGDYYDNRDRGHSRLRLAKFPQLDQVEYPEQVQQRRLDWALQRYFVFPHVTFGNSSTSSSATAGGSNPRHAMMGQRIADVMYRQYTRNHLYIYPEHRDHDPGRNGPSGHGDLYPANTPYLIISQGSSGSDRPFMEAVAFTLAAFRPEVKKKLVAAGLLMPTVQMVLRASMKGVRYPDDYLKGEAHPTVFDGAKVDPLAMVRRAHAFGEDTVPPMVHLEVVEEDEAIEGRDFIDPPHTEKLFDTPAAIARVYRSWAPARRMVVSAKASRDLNGRPLTFHWSVLRGNARRIEVRPLAKDRSRVELIVPYPARRPVAPGSEIESPRVDIGCFVSNGEHYSAPGFVTFYALPSETRTYDASGRLVEIAYHCGDSTIGYSASDVRSESYDVTDWGSLLAAATGKGGGLGAQLLQKRLTGPALGVLRSAAKELDALAASESGPRKAYEDAVAAREAARAAQSDARKALDKARRDKGDVQAASEALKAASESYKATYKQYSASRRELQIAMRPGNRVLTKPQPRLAGSESVKQRIEAILNEVKDDPGLYFDRPKEIHALLNTCKDEARKRAFLAARDELVRLGVAELDGEGILRLTPVVPADTPARERLTKYERNRVKWFNIALMGSLLYPGALHVTFRRDYADARLTTPRTWRDVYRYDRAGKRTGWTRYEGGKRTDFTADGHVVEKTDALGRPLTVRPVQYVTDRDSYGRPTGLNCAPLPKVLHYEYASDADRTGRLREP